MKTRKGVATLFILGALLLSTVTPVLGAPSLDGALSASIAYEVTACPEVTFTGSAEEGTKPYEFVWDFGDGDSDTGETVTHTYKPGRTYTVTLTVTDSAENPATATAEETLTLCCLEASASADPRLAEPDEEITFTGIATGGQEPYTFDWDFRDGNSDTGESVTHAYAETGIYDVTLTVTDATCIAVDTVRVAVGEPSEHILSNLIALFFTLPPEYVDDLREGGWGYGEIAKAYFIAQLSGEDIEDIIALREGEEGEGGSGWGQIMKGVLGFAGLHGYNLGMIVSGREAPAHLENLANSCEMEVESLTGLLQETGAKFATVKMACRLAQQGEDEGFTADSIIEMRQGGMNWKEIKEALGLVPERGPKEQDSQGQGLGKGQDSQGQGHGQGQGSQGQGHGKGQGSQGQGHGKGKGKGPKQ